MNFLDLEDLIEWVGDLLDANADGTVNVADVVAGVNNAVEAATNFADANADGTVNVADVVAGVNNAVEAATNFADADGNGIIHFADAKSKLFEYLDQNASGAIESKEYQQRMQEMILSLFDKDGNGEINSIDMQLRKLAIEIGENYGSFAKVAFKSSLKYLV